MPKDAERKPLTPEQMFLGPLDALVMSSLAVHAVGVGARRAMIQMAYGQLDVYESGAMQNAPHDAILRWSRETHVRIVEASIGSWYMWRRAVMPYLPPEKPSSVD